MMLIDVRFALLKLRRTGIHSWPVCLGGIEDSNEKS